MTMILKYRKLLPEALAPIYATPGAAAFDIAACLPHPIHISDGLPAIIPTGLAFEVPPGWVLKVFSRSGHGFKHAVRLGNGTGIIDPDYRGEVQILLTADAGGHLTVNPGDRIAQGLLVWAPRLHLVKADELSATDRGEGGFGSTGV
jgi:dUTP pyrophosphatase